MDRHTLGILEVEGCLYKVISCPGYCFFRAYIRDCFMENDCARWLHTCARTNTHTQFLVWITVAMRGPGGHLESSVVK